jgi:hypothetical protein
MPPVKLRWRRRTVNAPVISNIVAVQVSESVVRVAWDVDQFAQGQIEYGNDLGGPYPSTTTLEDSFDYDSHVQDIPGQTAGVPVYFRVLAWNAAGEPATSAEQTYTIDAADDPIEYDDYTVPTGANYTDGSDARNDLQTWFDAVPNGTDATHRTRVLFPAGFTWTISGAILVTNRSYITFDGQGTPVFTIDGDTGEILAAGNTGGGKIRVTSSNSTAGSAGNRAAFSTLSGAAGSSYRAVGLRWTCMQFEGTMPAANDRTSTMADGGTEQQHSVAMYGGDDIEFDRNNTYRLTGDGFYMAGAAGSVTGEPSPGVFVDPGDVRSRNIRVHRNHIRSCGRVGVAVIKASDVLIADNLFEDAAYAAIDYEPNYWHERIGTNSILRNTFSGRFNWDVSFVMTCIYFTRPSSRPLGLGFYIDGITTIEDNVFASTHGRNSNGTAAGVNGSGLPDFDARAFSIFYKSAHLYFRNNSRISTPYTGPAVALAYWQQGWTVTGNTGFGATGAFVVLGTGNGGSPQTVSGNS